MIKSCMLPNRVRLRMLAGQGLEIGSDLAEMITVLLWALLSWSLLGSDWKMDNPDDEKLVRACRNVSGSVVLAMLEAGADPTWNQNASLVAACEAGNDEAVLVILSDKRVNPTEPDNRALRAAATAGHKDIVMRLLSIAHPKMGVDAVTDVFRLACCLGHTQIAASLIDDWRLDINRKVHSGSGRACLLSVALFNGHTEIVRIILGHPEIDMKPRFVEPLVAEAARHTDCLELILQDGRADPAAGLSKAVTRAVYSKRIRNLELLLADGRVNAADDENLALYTALHTGQMDMARMLLKHGVDLSLGLHRALGELLYARRCYFVGSLDILKIFLLHPLVPLDSRDIVEALPRNFHQARGLLKVIKDGSDSEIELADKEVFEWALACSFQYKRLAIFPTLLTEALRAPQDNPQQFPILAGLQSILTFIACNQFMYYELPRETVQEIVVLGLPYFFDY